MNTLAKNFVAAYFDTYREAGYAVTEPGPLYRPDDTTVFAACTVSNYRPALEGRHFEAGSVMVQRVFRGRPLAELHTASRETEQRKCSFDVYGGYQTVGATDVGESLTQHAQLMTAVLTECGVKISDISFAASNENLKRWRLGKTSTVAAIYSYPEAHEPTKGVPLRASKVIKQYGRGVIGRSLDVFRRKADDRWVMFGTIAETISREGITTGIDYGGGLEHTTHTIYGERGLYLDQEICRRFGLDYETGANRAPRLINLLEAFEGLLLVSKYQAKRHPLSSINNDVSFAARATLLQSAALGMELDDLRKLGQQYVTNEGWDSENVEAAVEEVSNRQAAIELVIAAAQNNPRLREIVSRRRWQAEQQGHSFGPTRRASLLYQNLHLLDKAVRRPLPNLLLSEVKTCIK